jgi:hypothetical protein
VLTGCTRGSSMWDGRGIAPDRQWPQRVRRRPQRSPGQRHRSPLRSTVSQPPTEPDLFRGPLRVDIQATAASRSLTGPGCLPHHLRHPNQIDRPRQLNDRRRVRLLWRELGVGFRDDGWASLNLPVLADHDRRFGTICPEIRTFRPKTAIMNACGHPRPRLRAAVTPGEPHPSSKVIRHRAP